MSANKLKYFHVVTESVVQANNKADASAIARGRRGVTGKILGAWEDNDRISATDAKAIIDEDEELTA